MRIILSAFVLLLVLSSCNQASNKKTLEEAKETIKSAAAPAKLLRHVVMFNFNDDATEGKVKEIEEAFAGLPSLIPEIHSFEWGKNNSPEGLNKGLTHCFLVTFATEKAREVYLPHPAHKAFVELIGPYVEDVAVIDYWTE